MRSLKMSKKSESVKCVICNTIIFDPITEGCNPQPIEDDGYCCKVCDMEVVIPTRIQVMLAQKRSAQARADREEK